MADHVRDTGVRFDEAIGYLRSKLPEASVAWDSLAGPVHSTVFTVAGATSADLAADLQRSLVSALESGGTITQFRRDFDQVVQRHGWTYNGRRGWRTSVIFDTNMRSAHMAGRWEQLQANKDRRPFLQYRTAGDARVRPQHRAWNGLIFPIDDAFWSTHYPPNGWGCRCTVRAYGAAEMRSKGLQVSEPVPLDERDVTRAGEVIDRVPKGIDPGWDHNVGRGWKQPALALGEKLARLPQALRGPLIDRTVSPAFTEVLGDEWRRFRAGIQGRPQGETQIVGYLDSATTDALARDVPSLRLDSVAISVADRRTDHLAGRHKQSGNPQQVWPADWLDRLPEELRNYRAVLWDSIDQVVVVVPNGTLDTVGKRLPRIVLRPNTREGGGTTTSVVSLGSAQLGDLQDANRYLVLVGSWEP